MKALRDQAIEWPQAYTSTHSRFLPIKDHWPEAIFDHAVGSIPCNTIHESRRARGLGFVRTDYSQFRERILQQAHVINPSFGFLCFLEPVKGKNVHVIYTSPRVAEALEQFTQEGNTASLSEALEGVKAVLEAFDPGTADDLITAYNANIAIEMLSGG